MDKYIDKIIYINLDKRIDRRIEIEDELNKYGLTNYERFPAIEANFGLVGCGKSHLEVLKMAKKNNYKNVLILEDDFEFMITKEEFEAYIEEFFSFKMHYDVLMLNYNLQEYEVVKNNYLIGKVKYSLSAAGYLVNNHYYDKLIEIIEYNIPLLEKTSAHWLYSNDVVWRELQIKDDWYYFINKVGRQRTSFSNCCDCVMNTQNEELTFVK